jgi:hypothetical protein
VIIMSQPLLVIEHIETKPDQITAEIWIGRRRAHVVLETSIPGVVQFEQMPDELAYCEPARTIVVDAMLAGAPTVPADLSPAIRQVIGPWPLRATAPSVAVPTTVTRIERDTPEPGLATVWLQVRDASAIVVVDRRGGSERPPAFRFADGLHPWQATPEESHAMLAALLAATG